MWKCVWKQGHSKCGFGRIKWSRLVDLWLFEVFFVVVLMRMKMVVGCDDGGGGFVVVVVLVI